MVKRIAGLFRPKSNGVRVSRAAFSHIRSGDAARAQGNWREAAHAYRAALATMPGLAHIWVQYGHASKEAGDRAAATDAYARAAALRPDDPEPHMYLGHLARRGGGGRAARHYLDALRRAPGDLAAIGEVMQQLIVTRRDDDGFIDEALALLGIDRAAARRAAADMAPEPGAVCLDITDLLTFFSHSRIPSGVQRVQIEMVAALLDAGRAPLALCYYSPARRGWTAVAPRTFRSLCAASLRDDAQAGTSWEHELRLVYVASALSDELAFPRDAVLLSLGANSPYPNYLLDVRTAGARTGTVYVPMMYDLIPVMFAQWVVPDLARGFAAWLRSLIATASGFVAISDATRQDILDHAAARGQPFAPGQARVARLDGDSVRHDRPPADPARLARWTLAPGGYVLFVSTIEPRKNHVGAFAAWLRLARELGERALPDLVCVGGKGWMNDEVHAMLAAEPVLRRKVRLLSGIADDDLDLLYRGCAFTLYPSFYEGWGLPVTESLCHGKLPVVSDTSSLPEAGGRFAVYLDPHDTDAMAAAIRPLIREPATLAAREADIRAGFRPRTWLAIGEELLAHAHAIAGVARQEGERVPAAPIEAEVSLAAADRIAADAADGEVFRFGAGWSSPGDDGCAIDGEDAALRFVAPAGAAAIRVDLRATDGTVGYRVAAGDAAQGTLGSGERRSVRLPLPARDVAAIGIAAAGEGTLVVEGFAIVR